MLKTIERLIAIWPEEQLYLVGAIALEQLGIPISRQTSDIDVLIAARWELICERMSNTPGWSSDPLAIQRWLGPDGVPVDIVPAAPEHILSGSFEWPESGVVMSLVGVQHLLQGHCLILPPGIRTATAPLILLMKIAAWMDRPFQRSKDLGDIAAILEHYLRPDDDRSYIGEAAQLGIYGEDASAWLVGFDLGRQLLPKERILIERFVNQAADPDHSLPSRIAARAPSSWRAEEEVIRRFELFRDGWTRGIERAR